MAKQNVKTSVEIDAAPEAVWPVLTTDAGIRQWAAEYDAGMYAESDWKEGAEITWKFKDGTVCFRGVIETFDAPARLLTHLYEDGADRATAEPVTESYSITEQDGRSVLTLDFGPFDEEHREMLIASTEKAAQKIKAVAEGRGQ